MRPSTRIILENHRDHHQRRLENLRRERDELLQELGRIQDGILELTQLLGAIDADLAEASA